MTFAPTDARTAVLHMQPYMRPPGAFLACWTMFTCGCTTASFVPLCAGCHQECVVWTSSVTHLLKCPAGAKRLIPDAWRRHKEFDNIHKLDGVAVITVQLRYNGWITEMRDSHKQHDVSQVCWHLNLTHLPKPQLCTPPNLCNSRHSPEVYMCHAVLGSPCFAPQCAVTSAAVLMHCVMQAAAGFHLIFICLHRADARYSSLLLHIETSIKSRLKELTTRLIIWITNRQRQLKDLHHPPHTVTTLTCQCGFCVFPCRLELLLICRAARDWTTYSTVQTQTSAALQTWQ